MPLPSKRTDIFSESIIRKMTRIANQYNAINLSQGFPDFDPPPELLERLAQTCKTGPHQYAITWGAKNFRDALVKKINHCTGLSIESEKNIVVTCGSTEAMMASVMSVCDPGDKVLIFSPFYENYTADTVLTGALPLYISIDPDTLEFDRKEFEKAASQGVKALILCNPSNPTGKVFTIDELEFIASMATKYDFFVITDEVYEHIVYPPYKHIYFSTLPGMFDRTLSCSSLSKTYSITGWRLGYVFGNEKILDRGKKVHDFLTVGAAAPLQEAAIAGLEMGDEYYAELQNEYIEKKDLFLSYLDKAGLEYIDPMGAYYVMVKIPAEVSDDNHFAEWLIKNCGVAAVPGSCFYREPVHSYIRFHFVKKKETLIQAGEKLLLIKQKIGEYRR
ncbi:MAG: aminotransferase [Spirochaetes bacterium GWF1_31_7]|nr:MAG: aminotransferase [Spirochaetes bacterium GWE1_32_154]OHD52239.1 MAG: aminotransferase [Spirochaetes bacterium GWE2_31_10]OHD53039.1 MAG: aminotransferase [Spirochaetes bacterium GWF1_31_7]HBD96173.1 aminotransferase [Spirochaetia bacterium]HBI36489.1 aminotransferase [Spirochaetia bacterium]